MLLASSSAQKDAAFAAIAGSLSDESQLAWSKRGNVSPLKNKSIQEVFATDITVPELKGKNMQALVPRNMAEPLTLDENFDEISTFMDKAFTNAATGKKDIHSALREAQGAADQALAQAAAQ
ncbi:MAG: hypothetical protein K0R75_3741 [Paenibacillaceae bacterium]|jgi:hypothetical protein|nr:hypothetical protein [Paenibacillaceae bacterium]